MINLQPSENPGQKFFSQELLHLGCGLVQSSASVSYNSRTCWHIIPGLLSGVFFPPLFLPQPLQLRLPYPVKVGVVRQIIAGGSIAIAGAQDPHEQLRVLHLPKAHFQLSVGMIREWEGVTGWEQFQTTQAQIQRGRAPESHWAK